MTSVFSWQNSKAIFACYSEYIFTSRFCVPIPYGHHFLVLVQECVISSVQSLSRVWLFATPWITASQASLSITNSRSSLRLTSIKSVMPSSHLILCHPLLLLPPIPPSIRVFSSESTLNIRWPRSFSFHSSPSKEHPGLISFRMNWLDLLAVQGTLKTINYLSPEILQARKDQNDILW